MSGLTPPPPTYRQAWLWVTAGYLFQAIPAAVRDEALPVALKNSGFTDTIITQAVAFLGLLFGFKILLAPLVGAFAPRRVIVLCEALGAGLLGILGLLVAADNPSTAAILTTLVLLSLVAAGHDFALDGYFVAALDDTTRATHSAILNFASKLGMVLAGPGLIWLAGYTMLYGAQTADAWSYALYAVALLAATTCILSAWALRGEPPNPEAKLTAAERFLAMGSGLRALGADRRLPALLGLILFYRASEVHMARILPLFAKSDLAHGGLDLSNETYAGLRLFTAIGGLAIGGVIGSQVVARLGLARSLLPLGIGMHMPLIGLTWLALTGDHAYAHVFIVFLIEYIAYGAGLCALLLAMMKLAAGPGAATRYALLSTLALLANYLPGLWAGALATRLGYAQYFMFALSLALPGLLAAYWAQRRFAEA